ncbi:MAG: phytanoyl-CoA hydroxylase, partial [Planctomycetota bacterium]
AGDRDKSHTLVARVDKSCDEIRPVPIRRGDVTVHHERVLHGSGGNNTDGWRRAYILAFRAQATIAQERKMGFTHSHNDAPDVLGSVGRE